MATIHPRSRSTADAGLRHAEDFECPYPPLVHLIARDGFVDRPPRALELGVQNADLHKCHYIARCCTLVARSLVSAEYSTLTPAARCMPSRSCWAPSCCQLVHATCVAFSFLARGHLPLRLALVRQQLVDPHRLLRQLHQTARGTQWSTMQLTYATARPVGGGAGVMRDVGAVSR